MNIVFRVDSSIEIGTGHVMRCLTLADELKKQGADILFVTRKMTGHIAEVMSNHGFKVSLLPEPTSEYHPSNDEPAHAKWLKVTQERDTEETIKTLGGHKIDWLIVDHYALDARWHSTLRAHACKILVIDDLADRALDCNILLDQTYGRKERDYRKLAPNTRHFLMGTQYALLRPEFEILRQEATKKRAMSPELNSILVTMGGLDQNNITSRILNTLSSTPHSPDLNVDVVLNSKAPHAREIKQTTNQYDFNVSVSLDVNDMAKRMVGADLAIGASGTTTWERCCVGLPSLLFVLAKNQEKIAKQVSLTQAAFYLGPDIPDSFLKMKYLLQQIMGNPSLLKDMAQSCFKIVDGKGTSRVIQSMDDIS